MMPNGESSDSEPHDPPDRGHVRTEHRHDASGDLDTLSTDAAVSLLIGIQ